MEVPPFKDVRRTYGFDEVAIVPGAVTTNPDQTDVSFALNGHTLALPVFASAMDAVVSPDFAVNLGRMGGLGVLNLEGVWTRYEDADVVLGEIAETPAGTRSLPCSRRSTPLPSRRTWWPGASRRSRPAA